MQKTGFKLAVVKQLADEIKITGALTVTPS